MPEDTTTEPVEDVAEESDDPSEGMAPKPLRQAYNRTVAENRKLKAQIMETAYEDAKLDPATGLGKAIAKEYDGEPTKEALLAYAKEEYGYELAPTPENPQQEIIRQQQAALDGVTVVSSPVVPLDEQEALAKAEAERDFDTAGAIKANQLAKLFGS